MAISWGTELKNSTGNGMRVGYEFSQSPTSVGTGTSSVTVTCKVYVWTRESVYDSNNSFIVSGDFSYSGDVNISHGSGGTTTLARTLTRSVNTSYSGTVKSSVSVSLTGIAPIGGTARVSGSWSTGKRPISAPAAPSGAAVSRSSDTRQNLAWTRNSPTSASQPYQSQELQRWNLTDEIWRTIANLTSSATSYADSSTKSNTQYRYRIRSKNTAGASGWAYTDYMSTSPAAPGVPKAVKSGGNIVVSWANTTGGRVTGVEIWRVENGVLESSVHVLLGGSPTSWTHTSPAAGSTWAYRLKTQAGANAGDAAPNMYSTFSTQSNTVQLLTNPSAPSNLLPSASALDVFDTDLVLTWRHNSVDSSEQTGYDVRYRLDGGAWVTLTDLSSSIERRTITAGTLENSQQFEWQVRTYGDYATAPAYSPWSSSALVELSTRPAVTIISPDVVVPSSRVTVQWSFNDAEATAQTSYRVRLEGAAGAVVYDKSFSGAGSSLAIPTALSDGATYTVFVSAKDGSGMWSYEASAVFTVDFADPPMVTMEAYWDLELGAVVVQFEHADPEPGEVAVVSAELSRSANGEDWAMVAAGLDPSTTVVDFIPALDAVNFYRITSVSALPSRRDSISLPVITESKGWVFVNGGPGFAQVVKVRDNVSTGYDVGRAKARNAFAGRRFPVETVGEQRNQKITLSARIGGGSSTIEEWEAATDLPAPLCYRDGTRRVFVGIDPMSSSYERIFKDLDLSFERVDYIE